jgi:hypothetical protein
MQNMVSPGTVFRNVVDKRTLKYYEGLYYTYRGFIINDCPIAVGVENLYKFWMCRQLHNVRQTTATIATYRRY